MAVLHRNDAINTLSGIVIVTDGKAHRVSELPDNEQQEDAERLQETMIINGRENDRP